MKLAKFIFGYVAGVVFSIGFFVWIRFMGRSLGATDIIVVPQTPVHDLDLAGSFKHVFIASVVVIVAARVIGAVFRKLNQPPVMGELITGILLGSSFSGVFGTGWGIICFHLRSHRSLTFGRGKGLELIPLGNTEIFISTPPYLTHTKPGVQDGIERYGISSEGSCGRRHGE